MAFERSYVFSEKAISMLEKSGLRKKIDSFKNYGLVDSMLSRSDASDIVEEMISEK